jgi:hypothetical protein
MPVSGSGSTSGWSPMANPDILCGLTSCGTLGEALHQPDSTQVGSTNQEHPKHTTACWREPSARP